MTIALIRNFLLIAAAVGANAQPRPDVNDSHWGCYDASPGHPTETEKRHFIEQLAPVAQTLERTGGAPAAGVLAMASLESGFGFTRTALFANNLFGWKSLRAGAGGGRSSWALACQPASDPGNKYVVFRDFADSLSFVGAQLAQVTRYKPVTAQYHADRAAGIAVQEAVKRWVRGVKAAGYNPFDTYPDRVISLANNFVHPGTTESSQDGLYKYSADIAVPIAQASAPTPSDAARLAAESTLRARLGQARYLSQTCGTSPMTTWPGYEGRPVRRCTYSVTSNSKTLSAVVYLLNPSAANLTDRIAKVCTALGLANKAGCGRGLAKWILEKNGGQFPVAGFVIERKGDAGGTGPDPVYLEFRDGTTIVSADHLNFTDQQLTVEAMEHAALAPVTATRIYARIANASREDYRRAGGSEPVGANPATDPDRRWPSIIRANEFRAQDSGVDDLLRGVAMGMRAALDVD